MAEDHLGLFSLLCGALLPRFRNVGTRVRTAVYGKLWTISDQLDRIIQAHGWDLDTAAGRAGLESYLQEPAEE
jgi:hypothetical protein